MRIACSGRYKKRSSTLALPHLHCGQVCCVWKLPSGVLVTCITTPAPPHPLHVLTDEPARGVSK